MNGLGRVFLSVCAQHLENHIVVQSETESDTFHNQPKLIEPLHENVHVPYRASNVIIVPVYED
jgi:hypothetical protein